MSISRETLNVAQLGCGLCLVFFAFYAQGFIIETVLTDRHEEDPNISKHAGYYSQTIIYGCFIISNIIAPPVVKFLTPKWSLAIGGSAYTLYFLGFQFLNPIYLYASAAFEGLCAGVLWTAMAQYLALNSNEQTIGRNSGQMRLLFGCFAAVSIVGNCTFALLQQKNDNKEEPFKLKDYAHELKESWNLLSTDFLLLLPVFAYSGMELSFWSSVYSTALSFTKKFPINTTKLIAWNSIAVGIGELTGGISFFLLGKRLTMRPYGNTIIIVMGIVVGYVAYLLAGINLPGKSSFEKTFEISFLPHPSIGLGLFAGGLMGFQDACINNAIYSFITVRYEGRTVQAFAQHKLFHAAFSTVCMYYGSVLVLQWQIFLLLIAGAICSVSFALADRRSRSDKMNIRF